MAIIKCKMCGGDLNIAEGLTVAECEYCGTKQTVPSVDNEKKLTLFARANRLRLACEFDKAAGVYESIVAEFPTEAEAYWGLVLCRYGIEYVDDPATGKKIPTCHRSSFDSILEDSDFEQACENADAVARKVYREESKAIEDIRRGILEVSGKEEPYDIFICYKETDEAGQRTIDSAIAQDVYDALVEKGYRVFFSRITLEDKLGTEYEPYIFAALNSAKIMLVFGTDYEYFNAVWVKNEWSRFLSLIAAGQKKVLIPCYKGVDAYDMPKEFAKLQGQDMEKVGAIQDLLRGIDKILGKGATMQSKGQSDAGTTPSVESLLKRGYMLLEDPNWEERQKAEKYFDKALDIDPENGEAYAGKLCVSRFYRRLQDITKDRCSVRNNSYYKKAIYYGSQSLRNELESYIAQATQRKLYDTACNRMKQADNELKYRNAAQLFAKLEGYQDSNKRRAMCLKFAEDCRSKKLLQDNEDTKAQILRFLENGDGQFSARDLRDMLLKQKLKIKNIQTNCEALIQQGKIEEHKENGRTFYCLAGRERRLAEMQARLEEETQAEQEKQQEQERLLQRLQAEQFQLERELKSLGAFSFKRKKEIHARLEDISRQIRKI